MKQYVMCISDRILIVEAKSEKEAIKKFVDRIYEERISLSPCLKKAMLATIDNADTTLGMIMAVENMTIRTIMLFGEIDAKKVYTNKWKEY